MRVATDDEKIYIQKLIPDLGVFDIAEKYFAEGGTENNLFSKGSMAGLRFMANNYSSSDGSANDVGIFYKITNDIAIFIFEVETTISNTDSYFVRF